MAIDNKILKFLHANKSLIKDKRVLMIGRQSNSTTPALSRKLWFEIKEELYSEKIFEHLWCKIVESIDFNDYEKPTYIHDMNIPIWSNFFESFDIIFDWGTTEHIFNAQIALKNYRLMLKEWWYYIGILPSNNFCNHWFRQFSPDLFYRFFSKENWFSTKVFTYICEVWYLIKDILSLPEPIHFNINFKWQEAYVFVIAKKNQSMDDYDTPYQAIYNSVLRKNKSIKKTEEKYWNISSFIVYMLKKIIPTSLQLYLYNRINTRKLLKKIKKPIFE